MLRFPSTLAARSSKARSLKARSLATLWLAALLALSPTVGAHSRGGQTPAADAMVVPSGVHAVAAVESGWLGVFLGPGNPPVIREVVPGSPAARAGLKAGEAIHSVAGAKVASIRQLAEQLGRHGVGDRVTLELMGSGGPRTVQVQLARRPGGP